jgi:hypothetical protein
MTTQPPAPASTPATAPTTTPAPGQPPADADSKVKDIPK